MKGDKTKYYWNLYEAAVQDPAYTVGVVENLFQQVFKRNPLTLREDFCGTFSVGREWIRRGSKRRASGFDICEAAIKEAAVRNRELLSATEKKRAELFRKDVRTVSRTKSDVVLAENFSFFVFKTRKELVEYFRASYRSLGKSGAMIIDLVGGPKFTETPHKERTFRRLSPPRPGLPKKLTYIWHQERYDPATAFGTYSLDFEIEGKYIRKAFTYDWRVWTLPEVRDCMIEAGFDEVKLFWDNDKDKPSLSEITSLSDQWLLWLCLVVGVKR